MTCPSDLELSRALTVGADPEIAAHLAACPPCRAAWDAASEVIELARELPVAIPPPVRREEVRTAVLAASASAPDKLVRRTWLAPAALAAAAAGIVAYVAILRGSSQPAPAPVLRAEIRPHPGARYVASSAVPDQVVRLTDGAIDVDVEPLRPGERFRVIVGDAELEVRGTAFTVIASEQHLVEVVVRHGRVDLRAGPGEPATLHAGDTWHARSATTSVEASPSPSLRVPAIASVGGAPLRVAPPSSAVAPSPARRASLMSPPSPLAPSSAAVPSPGAAPARAAASHALASSASALPMAHVAGRPRRAAVMTVPQDSAQAVPVASDPAAVARATAADPGDSEPGRSARGGSERGLLDGNATERTAVELSYDQAWEALRTNQFGRAARGFTHVLLLAPDGPLVEDASFWRAVALARDQRSDDAIAAFRDFLEGYRGSPRAGEARAMLGWLLVDARAYDEAARWFAAAVRDRNPAVRSSAQSGLDALAGVRR